MDSHALNIEGQRQPPSNPALQLIFERVLFEELSCDSLRNTECFHKIMKIEALLLGFEGPPSIPPRWNADHGHVLHTRAFHSFESPPNFLSHLQFPPLSLTR